MAGAAERFHALLDANNIPVVGVCPPPRLRIDFADSATQQQKDQAATLAQSFDWLDKPNPKPMQFVIDCNGDASIPANLRQNINLMAIWFKLNEKAVALNIWGLIKASATAAQITAIQGHATNNFLSLP